MNTNILALLLIGRFGSNESEPGSWDYCLDHQFQQEIASFHARKRFGNWPSLNQSGRLIRPRPSFTTVPRQTASLEVMQSGYFPLRH